MNPVNRHDRIETADRWTKIGGSQVDLSPLDQPQFWMKLVALSGILSKSNYARRYFIVVALVSGFE